MTEWQPIETAPRDGTWILGCNDRGNCAVIIRSENAPRWEGYVGPGWIFPFSEGEVSPFWEDMRVPFWMPLPTRPTADQLREQSRTMMLAHGQKVPHGPQ